MAIDDPRRQIDAIDARLLELLAERREAVAQVLAAKQAGGLPLRDADREEELLVRRIRQGRQLGLEARFVTALFHEIIDHSLRDQEGALLAPPVAGEDRRIRVGFQGGDGAYSHLAASLHFNLPAEQIEFLGCDSFAEVLRRVEDGECDYAFLPIENTIAGSIHQVYDLLVRTDASLLGEKRFRVEHCLVGLEGTRLEDVRRILSHPVALAQCTRFLGGLGHCRPEAFSDTALAVEKVRETGDASLAAIASEEAARRNGLQVLARHIGDHDENYTRFLAIAKHPVEVDPRLPCKTSLVLATLHQEGALLRALNVLHEHGLNLTKLESRPRPGAPFQYLFYVDFEGNRADPVVARAMAALREATSFLKVLGSYPVDGRAPTPAPTWALAEAAAAEPAPAAAAVERMLIQVRDGLLGGAELFVCVGPAGRAALDDAARAGRERGARALFTDAFAAGPGNAGAEGLAAAARAQGLAIVRAVLDRAGLEAALQDADLLVVGGRELHDRELLAAVGRQAVPVVLCRPREASLDELLEAARRVAEQGNRQVALCEQGVRTLAGRDRRAFDLSAFAALRARTNLPLLADPGAAADSPATLAVLARAAVDAGADGLVLRVRSAAAPSPAAASGTAAGGTANLDASAFAALMARLFRPAAD